MVWLRPTLTAAPDDSPIVRAWPLDSAIFDVDGVLMDVSRSYRLSVLAAVDYIVRVAQGLADAPTPLLDERDLALFKHAGGFNNDWDLTQLLAGLCTARLREWRGQPLAEVPLATWARQAGEAARAQRGGTAWMRTVLPASAIPDREAARWVHDEIYWGARLVREQYSRDPRYVPDAAGVVHNEVPLLGPDVLPALVRQGLAHFGLITGRAGPEVAWILHQLAYGAGLPEGMPPDGAMWYDSPHGRSPFTVIVGGDQYSKPDPAALVFAVRALNTRGALYVGDTADDLDLVARYRAEAQPGDVALPLVLAVMVASGEQALLYQQRGADVIIPSVAELPGAVRALAAAGQR